MSDDERKARVGARDALELTESSTLERDTLSVMNETSDRGERATTQLGGSGSGKGMVMEMCEGGHG